MYTSVFLRFIHGVLDEFRQAEAFLFHTRLAYVSDAMKEKNAARALDRLGRSEEALEAYEHLLQTLCPTHSAALIHYGVLLGKLATHEFALGGPRLSENQLPPILVPPWVRPLLAAVCPD